MKSEDMEIGPTVSGNQRQFIFTRLNDEPIDVIDLQACRVGAVEAQALHPPPIAGG